MLAHGYTKWWFAKGISFQIGLVWVSVLDFRAVHVVIIWFSDHSFTSNRISCTQSDRGKPSDNLIIERWNNHQSQVHSRTEKVIKHDLHVSSGLFWLLFEALIFKSLIPIRHYVGVIGVKNPGLLVSDSLLRSWCNIAIQPSHWMITIWGGGRELKSRHRNWQNGYQQDAIWSHLSIGINKSNFHVFARKIPKNVRVLHNLGALNAISQQNPIVILQKHS